MVSLSQKGQGDIEMKAKHFPSESMGENYLVSAKFSGKDNVNVELIIGCPEQNQRVRFFGRKNVEDLIEFLQECLKQ